MNIKKYLPLFLFVFIFGCGTQQIKFDATNVINKSTYAQNNNSNGVILLDVNWGRHWSCGNYDNAQLLSLAFDKLPLKNSSNEATPDLVLQNPSKLMSKPVFKNYAYSIPAGKYALSAIDIRTAKSLNDIGGFVTKREQLFKNNNPLGGTFSVNSGEVVFLGNFYLDCTYKDNPTLWRYYPDGRENFQKQIAQYKKSFP